MVVLHRFYCTATAFTFSAAAQCPFISMDGFTVCLENNADPDYWLSRKPILVSNKDYPDSAGKSKSTKHFNTVSDEIVFKSLCFPWIVGRL